MSSSVGGERDAQRHQCQQSATRAAAANREIDRRWRFFMAVGGESLRARVDPSAQVRAWSTLFVSLTSRSVPFLLLGVALSAAISVAAGPGSWPR